MAALVSSQFLVKETVEVNETARIQAFQFGMFSAHDMRRLSTIQIVNRDLYQHPKRIPVPFGCLDPRLGISDKSATCFTCGERLDRCTGHFGYVKLELPVLHVGYFKAIQTTLQCICKTCSRVLLGEDDRAKFLRRIRNPRTLQDPILRQKLFKAVIDRAKKTAMCPFCGSYNGSVKKIPPLKLIHERYNKKNDIATQDFHAEFDFSIVVNPELRAHLSKAQDDLNPLRILALFTAMTSEDVELLCMDPHEGRPDRMLLTHILVPPVCIRPSVNVGAQGTNEDDLTMKLTEIIFINDEIRDSMTKSWPIQKMMEKWDFLQIQCGLYINSEMPGIPQGAGSSKPTRGFFQRLKGKTGRFRGNLSGKRVDFSSRTVISPDPNLRIDEVAVPELVAKVMTYPERVTSHNLEKMRRHVINGPDKHPGANFVQSASGEKVFLKFGDRRAIAAKLKVGDTIERHMIDGDVVLFNRQPSLHKMSIMGHQARIMPWRTFRFNECVCTPYNADFDGDEMNLHLPQTEEARAEALVLMGVTNNLVTPKNGEPLIAATQDFLTSSYLITRRDVFYDRFEFTRFCAFIVDGDDKIDLPPPTILKPIELWTGKQLFSVLIRPNKKSSHISVNFVAKSRTYSKGEDMCPKDGYVIFRDSQLICGTLDKATLGGGSKDNLFHVLMRDYSPSVAADRMSRLARLCARWIGDHGFSIGISDVTPSETLKAEKHKLLAKGYAKCDRLIAELKDGTLRPQAGCDLEQTLEAAITKKLSKIRDKAGRICIATLHHRNSPLIMALCGSKGSNINISQMITCVGQQTVSGSRIPNGFINRTLPHFETNAKIPAAKGFVQNSFYSGLTPTEFFFHTMGGREGLVDTAVKTAETGYMQRRLMKALEDLSTQYDLTVRDSAGGVVQFAYGDDGLDPASMEAKEKPIDFPRVLSHVKVLHKCTEEISLSPEDLTTRTEAYLNDPRFAHFSKNFKREIKGFLLGRTSKKTGVRAPGFIDTIIRAEKEVGIWTKDDLEVGSYYGNDEERKPFVVLEPSAFQRRLIDQLYYLKPGQLLEFFNTCSEKYMKALMEPGTAVGALGAQSIGEPGTQMTLKTFHFAGVASMNVTLGVPRIKEIINASKSISTPIITASLECNNDIKAARIVKGRIEKTVLSEISKSISEVYTPTKIFLEIVLDMQVINELQLGINAQMVKRAILKAPKLKIKEHEVVDESSSCVHVYTSSNDKGTMFYSLQALKTALPNVVVQGVNMVERAVVNIKWENQVNKEDKKYNLLVEGYNLLSVMGTTGVKAAKTTSNHIIEVQKVLGIEAARTTIINEIQYTMTSHGMSVDIRHIMLLSDIMTFKGEILGITRFGVGKMKDSVLMLASFEKTTDHLFEAAVRGRQDPVLGVAECIIMGIPIPLGTNLFKVLQRAGKTTFPKRPLLLDPSSSARNLGFHQVITSLDNLYISHPSSSFSSAHS